MSASAPRAFAARWEVGIVRSPQHARLVAALAATARKAARGRARPCVEAGVERYTTYRLGGMRDPPSATLAATNKCLAQSNKSGRRAAATKGRRTDGGPLCRIF